MLLTSSLTAAMAITRHPARGNTTDHGALRRAPSLARRSFPGQQVFRMVGRNRPRHLSGLGPSGRDGPPGEVIFFNLYYFTTGLHGFHVMIGAAADRSGHRCWSAKRRSPAERLYPAGERRPLLAPGRSDLDFCFPALLPDSVGGGMSEQKHHIVPLPHLYLSSGWRCWHPDRVNRRRLTD